MVVIVINTETTFAFAFQKSNLIPLVLCVLDFFVLHVHLVLY